MKKTIIGLFMITFCKVPVLLALKPTGVASTIFAGLGIAGLMLGGVLIGLGLKE